MQKAKLALTIYDEEGEDAMVSYLTFAQRYPDKALWDHSMMCTLPDGSRIVITNDERTQPESTYCYTFRWTEPDRQAEERRPLRHRGRFEAPEPCQPAISWPHTDSIQLLLLEFARAEAHRRLGIDRDEAVDPRDDDYLLSIMQRKAPSARSAVNEAINHNSQPESIIAILDALQHDWVEDAIQRMKPEDYEALVEMAMAELAA